MGRLWETGTCASVPVRLPLSHGLKPHNPTVSDLNLAPTGSQFGLGHGGLGDGQLGVECCSPCIPLMARRTNAIWKTDGIDRVTSRSVRVWFAVHSSRMTEICFLPNPDCDAQVGNMDGYSTIRTERFRNMIQIIVTLESEGVK